MTTVEVLADGDVRPVAAAIAAWQSEPAHHVLYVTGSGDVDEVIAELTAEPAWRERTVVARDDVGDVVGAVLASVDEEMGRVWWFGPWGVSDEVRRTVLDAGRELLPDGVHEEELAPDERNLAVATIAEAAGFTPGTPSSLLVLDPLVVPDERPVAGVTVVGVGAGSDGDRGRDGAVATLHDELFPGTHTRGAALLTADDSQVLAAVEDGDVVGYVATEVDAAGNVYVDYVGTAATCRRRGVARLLIAAALRRRAGPGASSAYLTVRQDAVGARAMYLALGFAEERVSVPWRRGFDVGPGLTTAGS